MYVLNPFDNSQYSANHYLFRPHSKADRLSNMASKKDAREQTKYQIGISESDTATLQRQGNASGERRGKTYGAEAYRLPNAQEENSLSNAGNTSTERRKHVTENVANQYRTSSGWEVQHQLFYGIVKYDLRTRVGW